MQTPREINIVPVLNGLVVKVGCQTVVFNDIKQFIFELETYLKDPERVEKIYREKALFGCTTADHRLEQAIARPVERATQENPCVSHH